MTANKLWRFTSLLSVIGIGLASYLYYSYLAPVSPSACYISQSVNCEPVTKGNIAEVFGVSVALIGLIGYIIILISSIIKNKKLLLGMTAFGMVFCLRLTILEIFVEKVICPVCVACQTVILLAFAAAVILNRDKKGIPLKETPLT
ncbi:hypothetical protein A2982_03060 [candidate division WWE3 bacterium RIFCSPLOWO2_01_FULL_39_13]|uniref:Vitamin K epoxide reductase domain-containing protein n=1 Tax=candidate division WWE3 bacterium RIFCSPLOWO2_01_FULL_39_13 TaxID=1802624 RepID=A0A1F4V245_UNCKA|nr:MAG: hypothetical protein A2982_03060 [candidate division WWE3 bacterium RIFCSPLOWO2_01_FULL_39_13]